MRKINLIVTVLMLSSIFTTAQTYDWIQTTLYVLYSADGVTELSRQETTYDSEGRQIGYNSYSNGALSIQYRDYQYDGQSVTYWYDSYSGGDLQASYKVEATYCDLNWIQTTLYVLYSADGVTELSRQETTYDSEGRQIGYNSYSNGALSIQYRDYQYDGRSVTYWYDSYSGGDLQASYKVEATYKDATSSSGISDWLRNSITIYPNPTKEELIIENNDLKVENIEIYDVNGKKFLSSSKSIINISQILKGTYFVKIKTDKGELTKKFIKE